MKHRSNTEMKIRVPSVFYPWPQFPSTSFVYFAYFVVSPIFLSRCPSVSHLDLFGSFLPGEKKTGPVLAK